MPNAQQKIEEQEKIIKFLREKYKQDIGHDAVIPQTWENFLGTDRKQTPILPNDIDQETDSKLYSIEKQQNNDTFLIALQNMQLPLKIIKESGKNNANTKGLSTNFDPMNQFHMLESLNLSGFKTRQFSRSGFNELLDSIADMRCLHVIVLRNNGISDLYFDILERLFNNTKLTSIDVSHNDLGKKSANSIAKVLKSQTHILWLNLSRNDFSHDLNSIINLISGFKNQKNLFHLELDVCPLPDEKSYHGSEQMIRFLQAKKTINSLALIDSQIQDSAINILQQILMQNQHKLLNLNFKYCFLNDKKIYNLCKGLALNRTLVKLNLSSNGLSSSQGIAILNSIKDNTTLNSLNLSKNQLGDGFAINLALLMTQNNIIQTIDISYNPIGEVGGQALLKALKESNNTIESLGDLETNSDMQIMLVQQIKLALSENYQISNKVNIFQGNPSSNDPKNTNDVDQMTTKANQEIDNYKILKPIMFSNDVNNGESNYRLWNI